ncbi:hypothetical protein EV360DRAFT_71618 [Lentinula raphanica]|nr:hypothetical protein EV360DRAFT_71618 [Lentinula raphanica]
MAPKAHYRTSSSSRLGTLSRNSSATRLGANLQFTQNTSKQPQPTQTKKNGTHDNHGRTTTLQRLNSSHRISSKDQLAPLQPVSKRPPTTKTKRGFIIASSPSDEADEDEWVSSESGAATPNCNQGSDSGAESEAVTPGEMSRLLERSLSPSEMMDRERGGGGQPRGKQPAEPQLEPTSSLKRDMVPSVDPLIPSHKPRPSTRPPSTHSISSRHEPLLRPHPLIRGQSFGIPTNKLAPLAMTSDVASAQLSSTPPVSFEQPRHHPSPLSSSPTTTIGGSPPSPSNLHSIHNQLSSRRTSISSAHSVATLPALREPPRQARDRTRTISTISTSSSSAAISSLAHIPATRPPSPQRLSVVFPPPSHPQFHTAGVHAFLPPPYLSNHLTTLAHRTPLRESYDRVRHAKLTARR